MSENCEISIIIVNFNAGQYLLECVRSLFADPAANIEVFVSDNGSTDNSLVLLRQAYPQHAKLTIIENGANLGFSQGNNVALAKARGKFLLFLNPDCVVKPGTLAVMQQTMLDHPEVGMAGCLIRNVDGSIQATCVRSIPTPWNSLVRVLHLNKLFPRCNAFKGLDLASRSLPEKTTTVEGISGAFMFVRREALEQVGALDEDYFLYCEDVDWMMRFQQVGWKILFVPTVEIIHAKSVCSNKIPFRVLWYKHKGMTRFYRKFFRVRYSLLLMLLVYLAIWVRFVLLTLVSIPKIFIRQSNLLKNN